MGKRYNSEWKYYKFTKDDETKIRFRPEYEKDRYEKEGYKVEELKPRRYNDETFKKIVKEVLIEYDIPISTTDLWLRCLNKELLLSRETFLRRLRKLNDEDICLDIVGSCYTWSIKWRD